MLEAGEVEAAINLGSLAEIPATLEAVARAVAGGRLDFKAGNTVVLAVNGAASAFRAMADIDERERKRVAELSDAELDAAFDKAVERYLKRAKEMAA